MNKKFIHLFLSFLAFPLFLTAQSLKPTYDSQKISKPVRQIVKDIAKENEIHGIAVGYGGVKTSQYRRFEGLYTKASVEELIELVEHPNPAVRGYAFWGLAKRHDEKLETIIMAHATDSQFVYQIDGCIGGEIPVTEFMRWVVTPQMIDWECKKLDQAALDRLQERRELLKKSRE